MKLVRSIGSASPKIKSGDIVTLLIGGPKMVVGTVKKGKDGETDYADCYWVGRIRGQSHWDTVEGKFIPIDALKLAK